MNHAQVFAMGIQWHTNVTDHTDVCHMGAAHVAIAVCDKVQFA